MGLLSTLKNALGLNAPIVPRDPEPLRVADSGRARLASLPEGHGVHVATRRAARGRLVTVEEGLLQGPPPDGFERLTIGDRDLERLRGLVLEHRDGTWHVATHLELRARETPNPHGRLYLCNRWLADGRPQFFSAGTGESPPDLAALMLEIPGVRTVLFRDNTASIERDPAVDWDTLDAAVNVALRTYFLGAGHRLTANDVEHTGLLAEVQAVLERDILPAIHKDGGDLQLLGVEDGVVRVSMHGACKTCPASTATLKLGVERSLKQALPDRIKSVIQV